VSGFISGKAPRLTLRRFVLALAICAAITVVVAIAALLIGVSADRSGRHLDILSLDALRPGSWDAKYLALRVPRVAASLLVGGALAGAGCALQALLRNPLAEPFTLGISSGSSLFAVLAIRLGIESSLGYVGVGLAALLGALVTLILVWRLAQVGRQLPPATLVLAGVTLSMFCSAASVLIQYTSDFTEVSHMLRWMLGALDSMTMDKIRYGAPPILAGLFVLALYGRSLNALAAGPDVAASLGVRVGRTTTIVFFLSSLLVGAAIAVAGPIGFIGLIVPHSLRAILGPDHRLLIPASVFGGAVLLTVCDTLARTVTDPLPTGAVTALLGGPFFLLILVSQKRRASLWSRA
jgi:iron complex transport system permease protein